jgi:hypothetical protein
MILPVRICTPRTSTSSSTSIGYEFAVRVNFVDGRPVARIESPAVSMPVSAT